MRQNAVKFVVKTVFFHNWTDRHFRWAWDGAVYDFPPGVKMAMEDWKAAHFAVHLVDQWCDFEKKLPSRSEPWYKELAQRCVIPMPGAAESKSSGEASKMATELLAVTPDIQPTVTQAPDLPPKEVIDATDETKPERVPETEDQLAARIMRANKDNLGIEEEDLKKVEAKVKLPFCDSCSSQGHFHLKACPKRK